MIKINGNTNSCFGFTEETLLEYVKEKEIKFNGEILDPELEIEIQLELLEKYIDLETKMITMVFDDDFLAEVPNARKIHNEYFQKLNYRLSMIQFKKREGTISKEEILKILTDIAHDTKIHHNTMIQLEEENKFFEESNQTKGAI